MTIREEKKTLRNQVLKAREQLTPDDRVTKSRQAAQLLLTLEPLTSCRTIMMFRSFGAEIDTGPFIDAAQQRGQQIWLPATDQAKRQIIPYIYSGEQSLRQGAYGIMEPDPMKAEEADCGKLEAVVLPGVAFDKAGGRLGYGGGYYDRFLSTLSHRPLLIGFCFSIQVVDCVPREPHDFPLDYLVTEHEIFGSSR